MPDEKKKKKRLFVSTKDLAAHVGVTPQRVNQYVDLGLPKEARNRFDLNVSCRWIQTYEAEQYQKRLKEAERSADYYRENARLVRLKADKAEDDLLTSRGQLIPLSQLLPVLERLLGAFKDNLLGLGTKLGPQLAGKSPKEIRKLLDDDVRSRLTKLSTATIATMDLRGRRPTDEGSPEPDRPASPPKSKRMGRRKKSPQSRNKSD